MNKNLKTSVFLVLLSFLLIFSVGCSKNNIGETEKNITVKLGLIEDKNEKDGVYSIAFTPDGESKLSLTLEDKAIFDTIQLEQYYMVTYNDEKKVILIENSQLINELMGKNSGNGKYGGKIDKVEKVDLEGYNLVDSYDLTGSFEKYNFKVSMYTTAEKDSNGAFLWDDGQNWKVVCHNSDGDFLLYDNYLQIGQLKFFVYEENDLLQIAILETGSATIGLVNYTYDEVKDTFNGKIEFLADDNVNLLYSSFFK